MNLYRSPGKRALSGLVLFAVGLVLSAVGLVFIGLPLFFFGLLLLFCFLGKKKAFYMGRCGTVSVVQVKEYSYPPLLFFAIYLSFLLSNDLILSQIAFFNSTDVQYCI